MTVVIVKFAPEAISIGARTDAEAIALSKEIIAGYYGKHMAQDATYTVETGE
jgi:hypothetical protein